MSASMVSTRPVPLLSGGRAHFPDLPDGAGGRRIIGRRGHCGTPAQAGGDGQLPGLTSPLGEGSRRETPARTHHGDPRMRVAPEDPDPTVLTGGGHDLDMRGATHGRRRGHGQVPAGQDDAGHLRRAAPAGPTDGDERRAQRFHHLDHERRRDSAGGPGEVARLTLVAEATASVADASLLV
jgi:hypothetical protein